MPASASRASSKRSPSRRSSAQHPKAQSPAQARHVAPQRSTAALAAPVAAAGAYDGAANRATAWVGATAAALTLIWTLWFAPTFALWMSRLPKWTGIEAYSASFQPGPFLVWVIPCLLLPPSFVGLLAVIDLRTPAARRVWSRLGLVFALLYAAIITANHWLQYAVVMPALMAGEFAGLSWLVIGNPLSIAGALEGLGYGAMGLATLCAGLAFAGRGAGGDRQEQAIRWLLIANGLGGLAGFVASAIGYMSLTYVALGIWCVTFTIVLALLVLRYSRLARA